MKVYESEKAKLKTLKNVTKISLTTDLWNSSNQKIEYMVLIGHWIDGNWRMNRRVLNFVHLPPPRTGVRIVDSISKLGISLTTSVRVSYTSMFQSRIKIFIEIVQQLKLSFRKLILHCKTRWNSMYEMLTTTIKFKKVFPKLKERDSSYHYYPQDEDWEKVCDILKVFSGITNLISGSDYPTSNLFLKEVCLVKMMLDSKSEDGDKFSRNMVRKMKEKFDKFWGECNVLMYVAAVLDPRLKMRVIQWAFPKMYSELESRANTITVWDTLYELYGEYVEANKASTISRGPPVVGDGVGAVGEEATTLRAASWDDFSSFCGDC
ncbi:zinc finger BED domain-containing protein RICESLEEPER 2-like [Pistacia vera]|uniref:zinc finger BED domain-containing protein RICESLEEPER 2-like n=1 Tax=Pistacia vera TaxID=55513 RepID=UPI001262D112|nr:zinc finger BED domain-containing protein RICESLEEPER 2-like [Pistacia vera]